MPAVTESNHNIKIGTVPEVRVKPRYKKGTVPEVTESNHNTKVGIVPEVTESKTI